MAGLPFAMRGRWHRVVTGRMVVVALLVGVVLAVGSVPVAAFVHGYAMRQEGWFERKVKGNIRQEDHVTFVERHDAPGGRFWSSELVPLPLAVGQQEMVTWWIKPADDSRPAFARMPFEGFDRGVFYIAHGWPMMAAEGRIVQNRPMANPTVYQSIFEVTRGFDYFRFPTRPMWSGLLANTLFYAALALAPMVLLRWRRTRRRMRRGLCVACGYELGEGVGVCPECGLHRAMGTGQ